MHNIIDGKVISAKIKDELKIEVEAMKEAGHEVCLAVIQVGEDKASSIYVNNKKKACEYIGIKSKFIYLPEETSREELLSEVELLNKDESVHGILVQLPLPEKISSEEIISAIEPKKDVDGFHPENIGLLSAGQSRFVSCTPAGILQLLKHSKIDIAGKECVIVGRSNIVGKPVAQLMLEENATVTIAHSRTKNLKDVTKRADILIVAIGSPEFITREYVKDGAVVIDVGIHRTQDNKLCGDVKYQEVSPICSGITPVPGGVGPMTIAMLMSNCVKGAKLFR